LGAQSLIINFRRWKKKLLSKYEQKVEDNNYIIVIASSNHSEQRGRRHRLELCWLACRSFVIHEGKVLSFYFTQEQQL